MRQYLQERNTTTECLIVLASKIHHNPCTKKEIWQFSLVILSRAENAFNGLVDKYLEFSILIQIPFTLTSSNCFTAFSYAIIGKCVY